MTSGATPRVSIGLPVHNGERFLRPALDTLLAQTFTNFELIVSDNASTDATPAILTEYAARDTRVRIERTDELLTAPKNFTRAFTLARGEFFKWHAADDEVAPEMLAAAVTTFDQQADAVGVASRILLIDENGRSTGEHEHRFDPDGTGNDRVTRFVNFMNADTRRHGAHEMFAVFRRTELAKIPPVEGFARADSVFLARLALLGRIARLDAPHFRNRDHAGRATQHTGKPEKNTRTRLAPFLGGGPVPPAEWWEPKLKGKINFPEWHLVREYARSKRFVTLTVEETRRFDRAIRKSVMGNSHKLLRDVVIAAEHLLLGRPKN